MQGHSGQEVLMPTTPEILAGLTEIAHRALPLAIAWHVLLVAVAVAVAWGWSPSPRQVGLLVAALPASAALVAAGFGNPFNAAVLGLGTAALLVLAGIGRGHERAAPRWAHMLGAVLIAFGWVYPHFLDDRSPLLYLVAAPVGLVPCPTLAVATGLALIDGARPGRAWTLVLAGLAGFYALFGMLRLGVWLDAPLLIGAAGLAVQALRAPRGRALPLGPRPAAR
jgi:hypothetical protein